MELSKVLEVYHHYPIQLRGEGTVEDFVYAPYNVPQDYHSRKVKHYRIAVSKDRLKQSLELNNGSNYMDVSDDCIIVVELDEIQEMVLGILID